MHVRRGFSDDITVVQYMYAACTLYLVYTMTSCVTFTFHSTWGGIVATIDGALPVDKLRD